MTEEKKPRVVAGGAFWSEMFQAGLYKRSQGRISRQITFAAVSIACVVGWWKLQAMLGTWNAFQDLFRNTLLGSDLAALIVAAVVFLIPGVWFAYRIVNYAKFADFLIAVEAEMNKVSWPSKPELIRAVCVVLVVTAALTVALFAFDVTWRAIFQFLGVRGGAIGGG